MIRLVVALVSVLPTFVWATLNIEITQGTASAVPIGVVAIQNIQSEFNFDEIAQIVRNDLRNSGRFKPLYPEQLPKVRKMSEAAQASLWRQYNVENSLVGEIEQTEPGQFTVHFKLLDVYKTVEAKSSVEGGELVTRQEGSPVLLQKTFTHIQPKEFRALAHHISDIVFERLTGIRGAFSTRIAYVMVLPTAMGVEYHLEVADTDGYNPVTLLKSKEPIMSPSWSPEGKRLAYVSFEHKRAGIYVMDVATGKRDLVSRYPGINGAPAWAPNGQELAMVLSKDGSPKIYTLDLNNKKLNQITRGFAIDTEPTYAPDGRSIYFTSNRGGKPQIYNVDKRSGQVKRVTFNGDYNARPMITADGKRLVMMHRSAPRTFHIASLDLYTGEFQLLTRSNADESPSLSPNGAMVLYGTQLRDKRVLGLVTVDGLAKMRLPAREGNVQEPAWSPFLS